MKLEDIEAKFYEHKRLYPKDISGFIDQEFQMLLEVAKAAKNNLICKSDFGQHEKILEKAFEELEKD